MFQLKTERALTARRRLGMRVARALMARCRLRMEPGMHTCDWSLRNKEQDGQAATAETQARLSCGSQSTRNAEKPEAAASTPQSWTHHGNLRTAKRDGSWAVHSRRMDGELGRCRRSAGHRDGEQALRLPWTTQEERPERSQPAHSPELTSGEWRLLQGLETVSCQGRRPCRLSSKRRL